MIPVRTLGAVLIAVLLLSACAGSDGTGAVETAGDEAARAAVPATTEAIVDPAPTGTPTATAVGPSTAAPGPTALVVPTATTVPPTVVATAPPTLVPTDPTEVPAASEPSSVVPPAATVAPVVDSSQEVLVANGGEVYTLNCARCHAENGTGTDRYRGLIGVGRKYTASGMIDELTNGHPVTFGFADRLSAEEIASVVAYVKATFP